MVQESYKKPPKEVLEVLDAAVPPSLSVSPALDVALVIGELRYASIADLARPTVGIAGVRIDAGSTGPPVPLSVIAGMSLISLRDCTVTNIGAPAGFRGAQPRWSPNGKRFALLNVTGEGYELWSADVETPRLRRLGRFYINPVLGDAFHWMPDGRTLLVKTIPRRRGRPPQAPLVPAGPAVEESSGIKAAARTYQNLLKSSYDAALFDYYASSQLALADAVTEKVTPIGAPAIIAAVSPAPDGRRILVTTVHRPYSYLCPYSRFPHEIEIWDGAGKLVRRLASLPLREASPIGGVSIGPRQHTWVPNGPATVVWCEALDGGDPATAAPYRDRVMMLKAPFTGEPAEIFKTEHRFAGISFLQEARIALVSDYEAGKRWQRTFLLHPQTPGEPPRLIWSRNKQDCYGDPGSPVLITLPTGHRAILQHGADIFLTGRGASEVGDRPFLDRLDCATFTTKRLFQSDHDAYESVVALLSPDASKILTRRESLQEPPNYFVRTLRPDAAKRSITNYADPVPQLRRIQKRLVRYERADGLPLSFTLYLPPDYKEGSRLPTLIWAYPREYDDAATASQLSGSPQHFTMMRVHLFCVLCGYAVLDEVTMPVVGDCKAVNDAYIDQIVAGAKAAVEQAVQMGVTDRERICIGGESYGACMATALLAHCDLFRAGIACSGAYNRTLTPFGFQRERRSLWQAPNTYLRLSPFMHAHKIKRPLLLIHGEADNNAATLPAQSERMYSAIRGNGGTVRWVSLPYESHVFIARESIEHVVHEMVSWLHRYVRDGSQ